MDVSIQFPSPALWHQVLSGPPVSRDQGTRNPIGGFNEMVHVQLAKQSAIAGLHPPPPRALQIQRAPEKDPRERNRNPQGQQREQERADRDASGETARDTSPQPGAARVRAVWA